MPFRRVLVAPVRWRERNQLPRRGGVLHRVVVRNVCWVIQLPFRIARVIVAAFAIRQVLGGPESGSARATLEKAQRGSVCVADGGDKLAQEIPERLVRGQTSTQNGDGRVDIEPDLGLAKIHCR